MTHDYKAAFAILSRYNEWRRGAEIAQPNAKQVGEAIDTAIKALRIADRLKNPSKDMYASWMTSSGDWHKRYDDMINQLIQEIEQEQHH